MSNDVLQRCAILMMSLGEDAAAEVFKHLNAREVQAIGSSMANLRQVSREEVVNVLEVVGEDETRRLDNQVLGARKAPPPSAPVENR